MTELFTNNSKTIIKQGLVGDCYLLAILDCLINTSPEGLAFIKSLFTETEEHIMVRIKRTPLSRNLTQKDIKKYHYTTDPVTNEDVFLINKETCHEIDNTPNGVQTDALAIKILERLCSYYFYNNWQSNSSSLAAHSIREMCANRLESPKKSMRFIAEWLSLEIQPIPNLPLLISLKKILPALPIYLSMATERARHAYRVDGVEDLSLILINPWNNQITERHILTDIIEKEPSSYLLKTHAHQYELACVLLNKKDFMHAWIQHLDEVSSLFSRSQDIFDAEGLDEKINTVLMCLQLMLNELAATDKLTPICLAPLQDIIDGHKKNLEAIFNSSTSPTHQPLVVVRCTRPLLKPTTTTPSQPSDTQLTIQKINNISISFDTCHTIEDIENHKQVLNMNIEHILSSEPKPIPTKISVFTQPVSKRLIQVRNECLAKINHLANVAVLNLPAAPMASKNPSSVLFS